jgi:hypothetical protein
MSMRKVLLIWIAFGLGLGLLVALQLLGTTPTRRPSRSTGQWESSATRDRSPKRAVTCTLRHSENGSAQLTVIRGSR